MEKEIHKNEGNSKIIKGVVLITLAPVSVFALGMSAVGIAIGAGCFMFGVYSLFKK